MDVAAFQPSEPFKRLPECCDPALDGRVSFHAVHQHADAPHPFRLLPARRERPSSGSAAERDQQLPPSDGECMFAIAPTACAVYPLLTALRVHCGISPSV